MIKATSYLASYFPNGLFDLEGLVKIFGPWTVLVVCLMILGETGLIVGFFLPGDALLITLGLLSGAGSVDVPIWLTCILLSTFAYIGNDIGYFVGRAIGAKLFRRERGLFSKKNVERTRKFFDRYGGLAIMFARFTPIVRTLTPLAAGVSRMKYSVYGVYNFIGSVIWGTGLTLVGYFLGGIPIVKDNIEITILIAIAILILLTIAHALAVRKKENSSSERK